MTPVYGVEVPTAPIQQSGHRTAQPAAPFPGKPGRTDALMVTRSRLWGTKRGLEFQSQEPLVRMPSQGQGAVSLGASVDPRQLLM